MPVLTDWFVAVLFTLLLIDVESSIVFDGSTTAVDSALLAKLSNMTTYNKHASPKETTIVTITMYIEGISSFHAQTMDFEVDIYFQTIWNDPRLVHNYGKPILVKEKSVLEMFWRPDLYFANARKSNFHDITVRNFLLYIEEDGTLTYDCRISLTVMCMMDLAKYPLDDQRCTLRILSYAYDDEDLIIQWRNFSAVSQNPTIRMADMELLNTSAGPSCDTDYGTRKWSCVTAEFHARRLRMHHYLQMYIPTGLIVLVSWLGFWIDPNAVPARVGLVITTLLTITTQANSARVALPAVRLLFDHLPIYQSPLQVGYLKAMDVWMGVSMTFVFAAMIEFTVAHNYRRRQAKVGQKGEEDDPQLTEEQKSQCRILERIFVQPEQTILLRNKLLSSEDPPIRSRNGKKLAVEKRDVPSIKITEITDDTSADDKSQSDTPADVIWDQSCSCAADRAHSCNIVVQESPYVKMVDSYKRFGRAKENFGLPQNSDIQILNFYNDMDRRKPCCPIETYLRMAARLDKDSESEKPDKTPTPSTLMSADIDEKSRFVFPISFLVFNFIYWGYYLYLV